MQLTLSPRFAMTEQQSLFRLLYFGTIFDSTNIFETLRFILERAEYSAWSQTFFPALLLFIEISEENIFHQKLLELRKLAKYWF